MLESELSQSREEMQQFMEKNIGSAMERVGRIRGVAELISNFAKSCRSKRV